MGAGTMSSLFTVISPAPGTLPGTELIFSKYLLNDQFEGDKGMDFTGSSSQVSLTSESVPPLLWVLKQERARAFWHGGPLALEAR